MPRISEIWQTRLFLIGLILLSLVPVNLQRMLSASEIYEIRFAGGLHPGDLLMLRHFGQLSFVCPAFFTGLLLLSAILPNLPSLRPLFAISIALFLLYLVLFLTWTVIVIELHVPVHYSPA